MTSRKTGIVIPGDPGSAPGKSVGSLGSQVTVPVEARADDGRVVVTLPKTEALTAARGRRTGTRTRLGGSP